MPKYIINFATRVAAGWKVSGKFPENFPPFRNPSWYNRKNKGSKRGFSQQCRKTTISDFFSEPLSEQLLKDPLFLV